MLGGAVRSRETSLLFVLLIVAMGGVAGGRSSRLRSPSCSVSEQRDGVVRSVSLLNEVKDSCEEVLVPVADDCNFEKGKLDGRAGIGILDSPASEG